MTDRRGFGARALRGVPSLLIAGFAGSCGGGDNTGPNEPPGSPPVAAVELTPGSVSLTPGQSSRLTATPRDAEGNALTGRAVEWATTDAAIATTDQEGMVTAVATGEVRIRATSEGKTGEATVTVTVMQTGGVVRVWQGGAAGGPYDWSNPANWQPEGKPAELDTVRVPPMEDGEAALSEDVQVARLIVAGGRVSTNGYRLQVKAAPLPPSIQVKQP